jgi:protein-disulfide isomerase
MSQEPELRKPIILVLSFAGILAALLSGFSHHLEWLASLCTGFGDGCKVTAQFRLFGGPVWLWGVVYYLLVLLLFRLSYGWLFWIVSAGFGVELGLMWIMFSMKTVCVFCIANFVVMIGLILCSMQKTRIWETLTVTLATLIASSVLIPYQNGGPASTTSAKNLAPAAKVAGQTISYEDITRPVTFRIYDLQQQIYGLERDQLDNQIAKIILEKEAAEQGKSLQELVKDYLATQNDGVEDKEVNDYYVENRGRFTNWKGSEQELLAQIRLFLQQQKRQQMVLAYSKSLGPKYDLVVYLKEPTSPTIQVSMEKDEPVLGPMSAPITIVEFSDYQCPACRKNHAIVRELQQIYTDRIRWVFKDFPLPSHKWARGAALAAHCAAEQGKFWEYQDLLFSSQGELAPERLRQFAGDLGLQQDAFSRCIEAGKFQARIEKGIEEAKKFGLDTTPTYVINNRLVSGAPPLDRFKQIIDEELFKAAKGG